ncbi:TPA: hypothetical protein DIC40_02585 [Patescibacteria group bacterium]|nr:hypothetical protein [Candidatus Gracilibacteria bacterium]
MFFSYFINISYKKSIIVVFGKQILIFNSEFIFFRKGKMLTDQRKQLLDDEYLIARNATDYTREEINEEEAYQNIKDFIKKHIHQVLVGKLEEDIWLTEKEIKKLPYRVGHFLRYSEYRGIKYYVLKKNDLKYISIGVF